MIHKRAISTIPTGGRVMSPACSSITSRPRQNISLKAPLACRPCQASHSFFDSERWLASGWQQSSRVYINRNFRFPNSPVTMYPYREIPAQYSSLAELSARERVLSVPKLFPTQSGRCRSFALVGDRPGSRSSPWPAPPAAESRWFPPFRSTRD